MACTCQGCVNIKWVAQIKLIDDGANGVIQFNERVHADKMLLKKRKL